MNEMQVGGSGKTVTQLNRGQRSQEKQVKWKWEDRLGMGPENLRTIDAYGTTMLAAGQDDRHGGGSTLGCFRGTQIFRGQHLHMVVMLSRGKKSEGDPGVYSAV